MTGQGKSTAAISLNVYKKVAIIRNPSDSLAYEDSDGNQKSVSIEELGDVISSTTPLQVPKVKLDIPVPRINVVETYARDVPANYSAPLSYVRYHRPTLNELDTTLEYIVDIEDENWLKNNFKFGGAVGSGETAEVSSVETTSPQLPLKMLQIMIDLLEKATGFESIITSHQADAIFQSQIPKLYKTFPIKARSGTVTVKHVINDVYNYWVQKRSKLKRPLLRRFWPVTSTDDTNPFLVYRPREKEKYKLRKKRQNDTLAYRKMKQLRDDFDNYRAVLDLVRKREDIHRTYVKLEVDQFDQRLYDVVDTSGEERPTQRIHKGEVNSTLTIPKYFDIQYGGRKVKRIRKEGPTDKKSQKVTVPLLSESKPDQSNSISAMGTSSNIAGRNHGEPAPNFLQPLETREGFTTSWAGAVPHVTTYVNSHAQPAHRFRHRPRVGRGGRICIDRVPLPEHDTIPPITVYTAGKGMPISLEPKERLLDLLPRPLDKERVCQRIEAISMAAYKDDHVGATGDGDDNDGTEVVVKLKDWLDTDDQLWGEERYAIGPI